MDYEKYFKMLFTANQYGLRIYSADGHRWIVEDSECDTMWFDGRDPTTLSGYLSKHGVSLNCKIYEGVTDALETINEAMLLCGHPRGLNREWDEWEIGEGTVCKNRISRTNKYQGGFY